MSNFEWNGYTVYRKDGNLVATKNGYDTFPFTSAFQLLNCEK